MQQTTFTNSQTSVLAPLFDIDTLRDFIPELPVLNLSHLERLTNQVSIIQHAIYSVPNYKHGYCLDDASRALILLTMASRAEYQSTHKNLTYTYLAYIQYMQRECGRFHNFLSFDHRFLDEYGTEDSYGRTIWALGFFLQYGQQAELTLLAQEMLQNAIPHTKSLQSVRAVSYTLLGLQHFYMYNTEEKEILFYIRELSDYLYSEYQQSSSSDWPWYEQVLSYDNAIIPLALLRSGRLLQKAQFITAARTSAFFLDDLFFEKGYLSTIGNKHWYFKGGKRSVFAQQPVEVPSIILLYQELFQLTGDTHYQQRIIQSFQWFFGKNELGIPLYDPITHGCCDGLEFHGVNLNQGAESTISFWQAYLFVCHNAAGS